MNGSLTGIRHSFLIPHLQLSKSHIKKVLQLKVSHSASEGEGSFKCQKMNFHVLYS